MSAKILKLNLKKTVKIHDGNKDAQETKVETEKDEPKTVPEIFRTQKLYNKTLKSEITLDSLIETKIIGLLFSASWCPPNDEFIALLKSNYREMKEKNFNFEIIYVPFDDSEAICNHNFVTNHGNWLLWPFDSNLIKELRTFYQIDYLPKLIIIKSNFEVIAFNGRKELKERGIMAFSNWSYAWKKSKV